MKVCSACVRVQDYVAPCVCVCTGLRGLQGVGTFCFLFLSSFLSFSRHRLPLTSFVPLRSYSVTVFVLWAKRKRCLRMFLRKLEFWLLSAVIAVMNAVIAVMNAVIDV